MPRFAAQKVLEKSDATLEEIHNCIGKLREEIGHLYCRCQGNPDLTGDLEELVKLNEQLEEKYNAKSKSVQQSS